MNTQRNSEINRILLVTIRSNHKGADHLTYGSPRFTGRHIGESPMTSIRSTASDRVVSDLPAYIVFSTGNCLDMTTRNSKPRATRKAVNSLFESVDSILGAAPASHYSQVLIKILHHYMGDKTHDDTEVLSDSYHVMNIINALPGLEKAYEAVDNPSANLKKVS